MPLVLLCVFERFHLQSFFFPQEKRGSEKEQDRAPLQDFEAMVAFCEQEG